MIKKILVGTACMLFVAFATEAHAQGAGRTDAVTPSAGGGGSTVVGGVFAPQPSPPGAGPAGAPTGNAAAPAQNVAAGAAGTGAAGNLQNGTLNAAPSAGGGTIGAEGQANVLNLAAGGTGGPAVTQALGGSPEAAALTEAVSGLLAPAGGIAGRDAAVPMPDVAAVGRTGIQLASAGSAALDAAFISSVRSRIAVEPEPARIAVARDRFNDLVMVSDAGFLSNPPDEFLAIHAVLTTLVDAVNGAL